MKFSVVRDARSKGKFTPTGSDREVSYDNHMLHVIYTDTDGKLSVNRLKVKTSLLSELGIVEDLGGKDIDIEYGPRDSIVGIKVIGCRNK